MFASVSVRIPRFANGCNMAAIVRIHGPFRTYDVGNYMYSALAPVSGQEEARRGNLALAPADVGRGLVQ